MALKNHRAAPIPNPPAEWDPQYMRQVIRVLELYHSQLDSNAPNYAESYTADDFYGSGLHITTPYGQFSSVTDQSAASVADANVVTFDATDFNDGVTLVSGTQLVVPHAGVYNVNYRIQFQSANPDRDSIDIWFRKNGSDIAASNTQFGTSDRMGSGFPSNMVASAQLMVTLAANDYIEVVWRPSTTTVTMEYLAAVTASGSTPDIPATPSAVVQVRYVSGV